MGCFSGCLMSSASDQKLFCGVCLVFKRSFDEFVGEKVVSRSYSSAILVPSLVSFFDILINVYFKVDFFTLSLYMCFGIKHSLCLIHVVVVDAVVVVWLRPPSCDPMDCSMPGFPVLHHLPELAQIHLHGVTDAIQPSHPLWSTCPPAFNLSQPQGLFQSVSSSHQVAKVLELQLQHQSFQ